MKTLEIRGLEVSFRLGKERLYALRGIDLELFRGEALAVVGESGSGKSVMSKAILGILPQNAEVNAGEVLYGGKDLLRLDEREMSKVRGRELSIVPQDPQLALDPITPVGEQIRETVSLIDSRVYSRKEARERSVELMDEVGIVAPERRYYDYPFNLSGGMRQRIAIAAALAADPKILICDEPTTALDVTIEAQILDLLGRLKKKRSLSMIFITHDLGVVARIADRVAVMYAGKIVEYGTKEDIFYNPKHPYTWALFSSVPEHGRKSRLYSIRGSVPDMRYPPPGDAFARRSDYALEIDYRSQPPFFEISPTHKVASWLYHPDAPRVNMPAELEQRIREMKKGDGDGQE